MLRKVYNNVEGHRVLDGGQVCEDITSISLPTLSNTTSTIKASGMAMDVDVPDTTHMEAAEIGISHNNGVNCKLLAAPGKHSLEARVVRQRYNVQAGAIEHEQVKFRATVLRKSTEKGTIETGNPYGSTEKFSVLRYEEILDGETVMLIDAMAGIIMVNGVNYTDPVENLLK